MQFESRTDRPSADSYSSLRTTISASPAGGTRPPLTHLNVCDLPRDIGIQVSDMGAKCGLADATEHQQAKQDCTIYAPFHLIANHVHS